MYVISKISFWCLYAAVIGTTLIGSLVAYVDNDNTSLIINVVGCIFWCLNLKQILLLNKKKQLQKEVVDV